jgi:uncharacterized membrane protein
MSLAPLVDAAPAIALHGFTAMVAFVIGLVQLAAPKGTLPHRTLGWVWVALMASVALSSFWIHQLRIVGPWSPIHLLSIFTLLMLPYAVWKAHTHQVEGHRWAMLGLFSARLSSPACSRFCPGGSCTRWCSAARKGRFGLAAKDPFGEGVPGGLRVAVTRAVSHWKNEGKNAPPSALGGGEKALDGLYDSTAKTVRISPCLTTKKTRPANRRCPRIFVPSPSSMR